MELDSAQGVQRVGPRGQPGLAQALRVTRAAVPRQVPHHLLPQATRPLTPNRAGIPPDHSGSQGGVRAGGRVAGDSAGVAAGGAGAALEQPGADLQAWTGGAGGGRGGVREQPLDREREWVAEHRE